MNARFSELMRSRIAVVVLDKWRLVGRLWGNPEVDDTMSHIIDVAPHQSLQHLQILLSACCYTRIHVQVCFRLEPYRSQPFSKT